MIILDTNIISELMRQVPSPSILAWVNQQHELVISAITVAEISYGLQALPLGSRRTALESAFEQAINEAFKHRVLSFDQSAAYVYAEIMNHKKQLGQPMSLFDGQIAAIALSKNASLATRNTKDFQNCGLTLINPFDFKSLSPA